MHIAQVKDILPNQARPLLDQQVLFIDVREVEEFAQVRIPGATLIPLSELDRRLEEIPRDRPVVLYCRSGNRSGQAASWLDSQGYKNLLNLDGGIIAWYQQGLPLDTQPVDEVYQAVPYVDLTPHEAQTWVGEGALVLDVREPFEFAQGHLPGAINIPLGQLERRVAGLPKDGKLLVVCASGGRSSTAAEYLVSRGFAKDKVGNLEGGTFGWMTHGLGVEH